MSRRPKSELQFGSDSFLDVVANIVGILIILIVIAGLRVSQAPVQLFRSEVSSADPVNSAPLNVEDEKDVPLEPLIVAEETVPNPAPLMPSSSPETADPPPADPPRQLVSQADELAAEIARLQATYESEAERTGALRQSEAELNERLVKARGQLTNKEREARSLARDVDMQRTSFEQLHATAETLLEAIAAEEAKKPPVEALEHRVTPLSKVFTGHEQHYRLAGNRVSEVPVISLTTRLKDQIERRKDWLIKQRTHQGTVGPVAGYVMHYLVQRDNMGVLDEVRYGSGMVRISVAQWRIEPQADLVSESAAEALKPGALFYDSLANADEGTSLTFWVYPDSYKLYRQLQKFAHEQGFLVAGRPLPHGVHISGSPHGSKSAGQ